MTNLKQYVHIKEAATLLGVSPMTLRNWDQRGKLLSIRNPMNGYRLYKRSDLEKLLHQIELGQAPKMVKHGA